MVKGFMDILFLRFYSRELEKYNIFKKGILYIIAFAIFYIPMFHSMVTISINDHKYILLFSFFIILHIFSKFILFSSKKIQYRFSLVKTKKKYFTRFLMIIEYIVLMWLVYLIYPITCILFPISMIAIFYEKFFSSQFVVNIILTHTEQYFFYGSFASYILFILTDGYKKLRNGFLPDYLGLYAILTAASGFIGRVMETQKFNYTSINFEKMITIVSQIFSISNRALSIVSSIIMFTFAIYSLYNSCGLVVQQTDQIDIDEL